MCVIMFWMIVIVVIVIVLVLLFSMSLRCCVCFCCKDCCGKGCGCLFLVKWDDELLCVN